MIYFDFGLLQLNMKKIDTTMNGKVSVQATLRHEGASYLQKQTGEFSVAVPADAQTYESFLYYDVPQSSMSTLYKVIFSINGNKVIGDTLEDIQLARC